MGYTDEELKRHLIGIISAYNEIVPGHIHLDKLSQAVKLGILIGGCTPILIASIDVCDGIDMGYLGMKYSIT